MASEAKLKVNIGADTREFEKGIRQSKNDLKAFGSVSDDVFGKLGAALGIDTKQVDQMSAAIRGMGQKFAQAGGEGENAFKKIVTGASAAGAAIAGIGIAGAVVAFKALTAEAENFKQTVAGANIELQTQAYVQTYTQVMHDFNAETGKSVAEAESKWKKFWGTLGANAKAYVASGAFKDAMTPWSDSTEGYERYYEMQNQARQAGESAAEISKKIFDIDRQRSDNLVRIAELERTIAESQRIMKDDSATLADRTAAYDAATQAINEKYQLQLPLMQQRAALMQQAVGLAGSTVEQVDAANRAQAEAIQLEGQQNDELRSLDRMAKSITNANRANNAVLQQQLELQRQIAQSRADLKGLDLGVSGVPTAGATTQGGGIIPQVIDTTALQAQLNAAIGDSLYLQVGVQIDKGQLVDLSKEAESLLISLTGSMSDAIGSLVGDLVTGGDAWSNFANAAMSSFADMAISIGKIAIATGVAGLGIQAMLESLNPVAAIAAGAALVALGAAVKAGLSNVANGNYAAGGGYVASSAYTGGGDYETRDVNIKVTGQLQADGDQLVAVINNTNNRNGYTT